MKLRQAVCAVILLSTPIAIAQPSTKPDVDTAIYHGAFEGVIGDLKIDRPHDGVAHVAIRALVPADEGVHCSAQVSGLAVVHGNELVLTKADDGSECRLTIERTSSDARIEEHACLRWHGASCSFDTHGQSLRRVR